MSFALGIDTGGTYTDSVLMDLENGKITAKAKAFTTYEDLSRGIGHAISRLENSTLDDIKMVSVSTTLATNAVVEGRGGRVGLLLIGKNPGGLLPASEVRVLAGGHDIKGWPLRDLDRHAVERAVISLQGKVDALAVSSFLSVRNPEHEEMARAVIQEGWDLPVVCAHRLSSTLGFYERTVTACLNARLLPIIDELIRSIHNVLKEKRIRAPLMIVRGDGSLMSEDVARKLPVETVLSGPAASVLGALFLTGKKEAYVIDMGGTTTDIAFLQDGRPQITTEGATVGGWRTRIRAADIDTFGLGGDSYLHFTAQDRLLFGPQRVCPLALAAGRYPKLLCELAAVPPERRILDGEAADCWRILKSPSPDYPLSRAEEKILSALADGPHSVFTLARKAGLELDLLPLAGLEGKELIERISLTPTDLLHITGRFHPWNEKAARQGAKILGSRLGMEAEEFACFALEEIALTLKEDFLQSLFHWEETDLALQQDKTAGLFLCHLFSADAKNRFSLSITVEPPLVGIGAPAPAYLTALGDAFRTEVIIPPDADVANAVGAVAGQVVESIHVLIHPGAEGFIVHAPYGRETFARLEEAEIAAETEGKGFVTGQAIRSGAAQPRLFIEKKRLLTRDALSDRKIFVETEIQITAVGRPSLEKQAFVCTDMHYSSRRCL